MSNCTILFGMLLTSCAVTTSRVGLIRAEGDKPPHIIESTGQETRLLAGSDSDLLHALHGYGVEVTGPRLGRFTLKAAKPCTG